MNKILVLFDSATGNVKQMADLVAEGVALVPDTEVRVLSVDEAKAELRSRVEALNLEAVTPA